MPESSGNPNASNGQYHGLGQTNQSWGTGSVASQTQGMVTMLNHVTVHGMQQLLSVMLTVGGKI